MSERPKITAWFDEQDAMRAAVEPGERCWLMEHLLLLTGAILANLVMTWCREHPEADVAETLRMMSEEVHGHAAFVAQKGSMLTVPQTWPVTP